MTPLPMPVTAFHRTSIDTTRVAPEQRVRYWEEACSTALVGFRCSTYSDAGLLARQNCVDLGRVRVAHTLANAHVIERTPELIRSFPRESIFINVIREGETFVYQRGHCFKVHQGDVLIYDARYPYLVGGAEHFSQLHIDIPADVFRARLVKADLNKPIQILAGSSSQRLYNRTLSHLLLDLLDGSAAAALSEDALHGQVCDLLGTMIGQASGIDTTSALSAGHLLAARAHIDAHLGDDGLGAESIAQAVGISERHLRRLFATQNTTVADFVLARRLDRAHEEMRQPHLRARTVAETAYRCGFASHAHFSRAFKQRFGLTPTQWQRGQTH